MSAGYALGMRTGYNTALPSKIESLGSSGSLTNIETSSDAWGRFIPYSWGLSRVGGALIWGSPFFKSTETFRTTTQFQSVSTWRDPDGTPQTETTTEEGKSTTKQLTSYFIDAAYSVGFEGDLRQVRLLNAVRINGAVVYDAESGYIKPGIGFSLRRGDQLTIDPVMQRLAATTGKYFYPGQTYIVFDKLPLGAFGDAMPQSVDLEFVVDDVGNQGFELVLAAEGVLTSTEYFVADATQRIYFLRRNENRFTVYDVNTLQRFPDVLLTGNAWAQWRDNETFDRGLGFWACAGYAEFGVVGFNTGAYNYALFDLRTGAFFTGNITTRFGGGQLGTYVLEDSDNEVTFISTNYGNDPFCYQIAVKRANGGVQFGASERPTFARLLLDADGSGTALGFSADGQTGAIITPTAVTTFQPNKAPNPYTFRRIVGAIHYQGGGAFHVERGESAGERYSLDGYSPEGVFLYSRNVDNAGNPVPAQAWNSRSFIWRASKGLVPLFRNVLANFGIFDVRTGTFREYDYAPTQSFEFSAWVGSMRAFFGWRSGGGTNAGIYGPASNTLGIALTAFLQTLYVATGKFTLADIDYRDITDSIRGALIVEAIDVENVVNDICFVYRIEKRQNANGILFYRERGLTGDVTISAEIDYSELAVIDEETGRAIETSRLSNAEVPAALTLRFIDLNNDYKTNEVTVRNPDTSIPNTQTKSVSLPIVMTVADAYQLALNCINDMTTQAETHRFRLPPKYCYLQSRDIIKINDRTHSEIIRITQDDFGGDFSVECQGQSIARQTRVEAPTIELPQRAINGATAKPAATRAIVFDTPLLNASMDPANDAQGERFLTGIGLQRVGSGAWPGAYVSRTEEGGVPGTLFNSYGPNELFVMKCTNALTDKRFVVDSDKLTGSIQGTWYPENNKTTQEIDESTDTNHAFYGVPGRWEIVRFRGVFNGEIVGIVRGLRGTEHHCGKHEVGDLFVIPQFGMGVAVQPKSKVGTVETFRGVTDGALYQQAADDYSAPAEANSLRPFIPANIRAKRQPGGDIAVTWDRRDRLGRSGWGASALPASDGALSYVVAVYAPGGAILRVFPGQAGTALTYTAAQQTADGLSGAAEVRLTVQAIGKLSGFKEVRAYNV